MRPWRGTYPWLKYVAIALLLGSFVPMSGQDAQFSQQLASPLWINPAMSGADGYMRGALNYRTQWNAVADPFTTAACSFDIALNQSPDPRGRKKGKPGVGIAFLNDRAGNPTFQNTKVMLTGAYHVNLDKSSNLGAGMYAGYHAQSVDVHTGQWGSQYNGMQYDPGLPHGENFQPVQQSALDIGAGLVYVYRREGNVRHRIKRREIKIGLSGYHLGRVMLQQEDIQTAHDEMRFTGFFSGAFGVGKSGSAIEPEVFFHRQGNTQMILAGISFRHVFRSGTSIMQKSRPISFGLGGFYRVGDAAVVVVSFAWDALSIGLSYDINVSGLSQYSSGQGAMEISLRYHLLKPSFRR